MRLLLSICLAILCSITTMFGQDTTKISVETEETLPAPKPLSKKIETAVDSESSNFSENETLSGEPDLKWGQVSIEHLKMTEYELDTSANEVLLLSYSKIDRAYYKGEYGVFYDYHFRIKVLDKSKYQGGEIELVSDPYDQLVNMKGQTINWVDDAVERVKVKEILKDDQGRGRTLNRFSFPEIKDGSVLEYKYRIFNANSFFIETQYMQSSMPTVWSELRFFEMEELDYKLIPMGNNLKFDYKKEESVAGNSVHDGGTEYRWIIKDVMAQPSEGYTAAYRNSLTRIKIQLHAYQFDNAPKRYVVEDWEEFAEGYYKSESAMAEALYPKSTKKLKKALKPKLAGLVSKKDRMVAIYDFVRDNMDWTEHYSMYLSRDLKQVFKSRTGNSADINFLLIAALRAYGIKAYPVLISTRGNGRLYKDYPLARQFNHVIVQVELGDDTYLLDAIYKYIPHNLIPYPNLNYDGLLIQNSREEWIEIKSEKARKVVFADLELSEDGLLSGTFNYERDYYRGFSVRIDYEEEGQEKYEKNYFSQTFPGAEVTNLTFENLEDYSKPVIEKMDFKLEDGGQVAGDLIYFNLLMGLGYSESRFREPERFSPVEMSYPILDDYTFKIKIPEGYIVDELPEAMTLTMPGNGANYKLTISEADGYINYNTRLEIKKIYYEINEYNVIKDFVDKVVEKQTSQIVLKKKS